MKISFQSHPYSRIPTRLQPWFSRVVESLERLPEQDLQTVFYPEGTDFGEAFSMSESLNTLFHSRVERERRKQIPVSAEFIWKD
jgi:hypothetical protein